MEGTPADRPQGDLLLPERTGSGSERLLTALAAPGLGGWLLGLVLASITYAAFASGATSIPEETRVQVAIGVAVALAGLGLASGALGAARSPYAWAGAGLLGLLALFSALSVGWSAAPDLSWLATNRAADYAAVVAVVLVAAPSVRRAPELAVGAITVLGLVVALYALGGKLFPEISIGPIDLNQTTEFARLRAPLGYWNALGLLLVMATPGCLWIAADPARSERLAVGALLGLQLLLMTMALSLSRGGLIAFAVVIGVMVGAGPDRLRRAAAVSLAIAAALPAVAFAFSRDSLTTNGLSTAQRSGDGALLALVLALCAAALAAVALRALRKPDWYEEIVERRIAARARELARPVAIGVAAVLLILVATGSIARLWRGFRKPVAVSNQPGRLVSTSSSNRWVWWTEAAGAFSDRPVAGWGAGSFPILHNLYRHTDTEVRSTHSVPLQFLSEGGLIGAALGLGGLALLGAAAVKTTRRSEAADRAARLALLAAAGAWAVHSLYDWDWEIPAITLPALAAAAIAATPAVSGAVPAAPLRLVGDARRRAALAGVAALLAVSIALSAALPSLARDSRLDAELKASVAPDSAALMDAANEALDAHDLNPLDVEATFVAADLQARIGDLSRAQQLFVDAARLEPSNVLVWERLGEFATAVGSPDLARAAADKQIATDPLSFAMDPLIGAGRAFALEVPPQLSPTAFGTPPK